MEKQDDLINGAGDRDKALRALLSRTSREQAVWDKFKRSGASDTAIINHLRAIVPKTGRTGSDHGVCCVQVKPKLAFWFGSYAVGSPTYQGSDLILYVREVMEIHANGSAAPEDPKAEEARLDRLTEATSTVIEAPETSMQLSLFDYSQLDEDDAIVVRAAATEIQSRMASMQFNFVEVGRRLSDVKERIGRGHFEEWLKAEFGMSRDSAERWIQAAEFVNQSPQIAEKVKAKQFSKSAVYLLAAPGTPEGAREEVASRLEAGQEVGHATAKEIVDRHKAAAEAESAPDATEDLFPAGKCRECGCTTTAPCVVDAKTGETCGWTDESETLCTKCGTPESEPVEAEVVASGRTLEDLLSLLKATPAGIQAEDLVKLDFSARVIEEAHNIRLIDRTVKGLCSYSWTSADVVAAIKEHGPMGLIDLEQLGCKRYAVEVAKSEGLIEQQGSKWAVAPETKAKKIAERRDTKRAPDRKQASSRVGSQSSTPSAAPRIESLLKGRAFFVGYMWLPELAGKCTVSVRVGKDIIKTKSETFGADQIRQFPEPVQRMILQELTGRSSLPIKAPAAATKKKPTAKKPAWKKAQERRGKLAAQQQGKKRSVNRPAPGAKAAKKKKSR